MKIGIQEVFRACSQGELEQLKRWKAADQLPDLTVKFYNSSLHEYAAEKNQFDVMKWLITESGTHFPIQPEKSVILRFVAVRGRLDILQWLCKEAGQPVEPSAITDKVFEGALVNGYLAMANWILDEFRSADSVDVLQKFRAGSALYGHLHLIKMFDKRIARLDPHAAQLTTKLTYTRVLLPELKRRAVLWYGFDPGDLSQTELAATLAALPDKFDVLEKVSAILDQAGVSEQLTSRKEYLCASVVQAAVQHQLATTLAELDMLLSAQQREHTRGL